MLLIKRSMKKFPLLKKGCLAVHTVFQNLEYLNIDRTDLCVYHESNRIEKR